MLGAVSPADLIEVLRGDGECGLAGGQDGRLACQPSATLGGLRPTRGKSDAAKSPQLCLSLTCVQ